MFSQGFPEINKEDSFPYFFPYFPEVFQHGFSSFYPCDYPRYSAGVPVTGYRPPPVFVGPRADPNPIVHRPREMQVSCVRQRTSRCQGGAIRLGSRTAGTRRQNLSWFCFSICFCNLLKNNVLQRLAKIIEKNLRKYLTKRNFLYLCIVKRQRTINLSTTN